MQTTFTFKTDKKLRDAAKKTAQKLGIPLTIVLNTRLREFVQNGYFETSLTPRPEKLREWERMSEELKTHPERFRVTSAEDFIKELRG
jgi:antitoxin component of RelBE/YafQ-DinJ toxin-antitoxin module